MEAIPLFNKDTPKGQKYSIGDRCLTKHFLSQHYLDKKIEVEILYSYSQKFGDDDIKNYSVAPVEDGKVLLKRKWDWVKENDLVLSVEKEQSVDER